MERAGVLTRPRCRRPATVVLAYAFALCCAVLIWLAPAVRANPFEAVAQESYAYDVVRRLDGRGLGNLYVQERVRSGEAITYFDLAIWVGQVIEALRAEYASAHEGDAHGSVPLAALVENFNRRYPSLAIDADLEGALARLEGDVAGYMVILGYSPTREDRAGGAAGVRPAGVARFLENLRARSGAGLRFASVGADVSGARAFGDDEHSEGAADAYTLEVVAQLAPTIRYGTDVSRQHASSAGEGASLAVTPSAPDVGAKGTGIGRSRDLGEWGLSELALGDLRGLSGLQAGLHIETPGSTIVVGRHEELTGRRPFGGGEGVERLLTAWDGALPLSDRLTLGATLAHLAVAPPEGTSSVRIVGENTVVRVGGTYALSPQVIISGEMARSAEADGGGEAVKIGAILHPLPDLTLGASLLTADSGYRPIFGEKSSPVSRIDLSAEVGRWILSLRRQYMRAEGSETGGTLPLGESGNDRGEEALASGSRGREGNSQTEVDLKLRLDQGRVSLGYVLEDVKDRAGAGGATPVRVARASVEHAVGPIGTATAGFVIIDRGERSESSSNLGLRYEFQDASVSLRYEIFSKGGDERENVTTAELSIRF